MAKEKPILLFTAEMIRARREGRKTVTRQVIKLPDCVPALRWEYDGISGDDHAFVLTDGTTNYDYHFVKPKYQVGDLLWVKEALWESECGKYFAYGGYEKASVIRISDGRFYYGGDTRDTGTGKPGHRFMVGGYSNRDTGKGSCRKHRFILSIGEYDTTKKIVPCTGNTEITSFDILFTKKRSSRFMPKKFARDWIEVIGNRAERLQDITGEDALAEGIEEFFWDKECAKYPHIAKEIAGGKRWWKHVIIKRGRKNSVWDCSIKAYREHWDDINARPKPIYETIDGKKQIVGYVSYPWEDIREEREYRGKVWHVIGNPWVGRYEFKEATHG